MQGRNEREYNSPGTESLRRVSKHCGGSRKVLKMSQVLFSIQYICFQKTSGSSMGALNLLLVPGAIGKST